MNCFKGFAKTISFLFYIFEIYVQRFLRNTLLKILLIESIFFKKADEWYIKWQRVTSSDNEWYNEWQQMTMSGTKNDSEWQPETTKDNEWQWVTASGKTNENGTKHIK